MSWYSGQSEDRITGAISDTPGSVSRAVSNYRFFEPMSETIPAPMAKTRLAAVRESISKVIRGKDEIIEQVLVCLTAGGHLLIEDLPGLGKTTLAYCLARALECHFTRIQFTSDLLPSDVIGVSLYDESVREFVFKRGPIFTHILLADEINRTTPKTQSALLEAMDRGRVTVDGQTYRLEPPFMVFATQNPVDYEGAFPLPESQMDRFLMRLRMGYPDAKHELEILREGTIRYDGIDSETVLTRADVVQLQSWAESVYVEETVLRYILDITRGTRTEASFRAGISPRGALSLKRAAQAVALLRGRSFVIPEDVMDYVAPVYVHRLSLHKQSTDLLEERHAVEAILKKIVQETPVPR